MAPPLYAVLILLLLGDLAVAALPATQPTPAETAITLFAAAQPAGAAAPPAFVRQVRPLTLQAGENTFELTDLPREVDAATVRLRPLSGEVRILEQSFRHDLRDVDQLLRFHLGRDILINRKQSGPDERTRNPETIHARLLAFDQQALVLGTSNRQLPIQLIPRAQDISEIKFMAQPDGPALRPTVRGLAHAPTSGTFPVELAFRTRGLTWSAEYTLHLRDEGPAELAGWVSIANASGSSYPSASLRLAWPAPAADARAGRLDVPRRVNVADGGTLRVPLFPAARGLGIESVLVFDPQRILPRLRSSSADDPPFGAVEQGLVIQNSVENALGMPLPPGLLRMEREEPDGNMEDLGETPLPALAPGQPIRVRAGLAAGITGRRAVGHDRDLAKAGGPAPDLVEVTLQNRGRGPVEVLVIDRLPAAGATLASATHRADIDEDGLVRFRVRLGAGEPATLRYAFRQEER